MSYHYPFGLGSLLLGLIVLLCVVSAATAANRSILLIVPTASDDRVAPSREAVAFWNDRLAELRVETRLETPQVVVASPVVRALENYARQVVQRATRLPAGDAEPARGVEKHEASGDEALLGAAAHPSWRDHIADSAGARERK